MNYSDLSNNNESFNFRNNGFNNNSLYTDFLDQEIDDVICGLETNPQRLSSFHYQIFNSPPNESERNQIAEIAAKIIPNHKLPTWAQEIAKKLKLGLGPIDRNELIEDLQNENSQTLQAYIGYPSPFWLNIKDEQDRTLLHLALLKGDIEKAMFWISLCPDLIFEVDCENKLAADLMVDTDESILTKLLDKYLESKNLFKKNDETFQIYYRCLLQNDQRAVDYIGKSESAVKAGPDYAKHLMIGLWNARNGDHPLELCFHTRKEALADRLLEKITQVLGFKKFYPWTAAYLCGAKSIIEKKLKLKDQEMVHSLFKLFRKSPKEIDILKQHPLSKEIRMEISSGPTPTCLSISMYKLSFLFAIHTTLGLTKESFKELFSRFETSYQISDCWNLSKPFSELIAELNDEQRENALAVVVDDLFNCFKMGAFPKDELKNEVIDILKRELDNPKCNPSKYVKVLHILNSQELSYMALKRHFDLNGSDNKIAFPMYESAASLIKEYTFNLFRPFKSIINSMDQIIKIAKECGHSPSVSDPATNKNILFDCLVQDEPQTNKTENIILFKWILSTFKDQIKPYINARMVPAEYTRKGIMTLLESCFSRYIIAITHNKNISNDYHQKKINALIALGADLNSQITSQSPFALDLKKQSYLTTNYMFNTMKDVLFTCSSRHFLDGLAGSDQLGFWNASVKAFFEKEYVSESNFDYKMTKSTFGPFLVHSKTLEIEEKDQIYATPKEIAQKLDWIIDTIDKVLATTNEIITRPDGAIKKIWTLTDLLMKSKQNFNVSDLERLVKLKKYISTNITNTRPLYLELNRFDKIEWEKALKLFGELGWKCNNNLVKDDKELILWWYRQPGMKLHFVFSGNKQRFEVGTINGEAYGELQKETIQQIDNSDLYEKKGNNTWERKIGDYLFTVWTYKESKYSGDFKVKYQQIIPNEDTEVYTAQGFWNFNGLNEFILNEYNAYHPFYHLENLAENFLREKFGAGYFHTENTPVRVDHFIAGTPITRVKLKHNREGEEKVYHFVVYAIDYSTGGLKKTIFPCSDINVISLVKDHIAKHESDMKDRVKQLSETSNGSYVVIESDSEPLIKDAIAAVSQSEGQILVLVNPHGLKTQVYLKIKYFDNPKKLSFAGILRAEQLHQILKAEQAEKNEITTIMQISNECNSFEFNISYQQKSLGDLYTACAQFLNDNESTIRIAIRPNPIDRYNQHLNYLFMTKDKLLSQYYLLDCTGPQIHTSLRRIIEIFEAMCGLVLNQDKIKTISFNNGQNLIHNEEAPVDLDKANLIFESLIGSDYLKEKLNRKNLNESNVRDNLRTLITHLKTRSGIKSYTDGADVNNTKFAKEYRQMRIQLTQTIQHLQNDSERLHTAIVDIAINSSFCGNKISGVIQDHYVLAFGLMDKFNEGDVTVSAILNQLYGNALMETIELLIRNMGNRDAARQTIHVYAYIRNILKNEGYVLPPDLRETELQDFHQNGCGQLEFSVDAVKKLVQAALLPQLIKTILEYQDHAKKIGGREWVKFGELIKGLYFGIKEHPEGQVDQASLDELNHLKTAKDKKESDLTRTLNDMQSNLEGLKIANDDAWKTFELLRQKVFRLSGNKETQAELSLISKNKLDELQKLDEMQKLQKSQESEESQKSKESKESEEQMVTQEKVGSKRKFSHLSPLNRPLDQDLFEARHLLLTATMRNAEQNYRKSIKELIDCQAEVEKYRTGTVAVAEICRLEEDSKNLQQERRDLLQKFEADSIAVVERWCEKQGYITFDDIDVANITAKGVMSLLNSHSFLSYPINPLMEQNQMWLGGIFDNS